MKNAINLLIADDHQLFIDGLRNILENVSFIDEIYTANNGIELLELLEKNQVHVILLDINMPVMNGLETMKRIRKLHPDIKVIGVSMMDELNLIRRFIDYGANGFLLKNAGQDEVILAIKKVIRNEEYLDQNIVRKMFQSGKTYNESNIDMPAKLSRREKEILRLIVDEFTMVEIAGKLNISAGTVETHRRNIMNKLDVKNTAGMVRVCMEYGLLN